MSTSATSPVLDSLYRQAIVDPASITRADENTIRGQPPPEEEDRLCATITGATRPELVAKAVAHPQDLTQDECKILVSSKGVNFRDEENLSLDELLEGIERRRRERNLLRENAIVALNQASSEDTKQALQAAHSRLAAIQHAEDEAYKSRWAEHEGERRLREGTAWIRGMLKTGLLENGKDCWGFVVFRTGCYDDDAAWEHFQACFSQTGETAVMWFNLGPLIWPSFRAVFVSDPALNGASTEQLRERFKAMRDSGELPKGIRTNCFLIADAAAINSEATTMTYEMRREPGPTVFIRAADPDYKPPLASPSAATAGCEGKETASQNDANREARKEREAGGFTGEVTLALPKVFDWFHWLCYRAERGVEVWQRTVPEAIKTPSLWTPMLAENTGVPIYYGADDPPLDWMGPPADLVDKWKEESSRSGNATAAPLQMFFADVITGFQGGVHNGAQGPR
ncbi:hypothetical protein GQ53DRAFT_839891 [Thozetella sp. PMI_491]|nr:hypothetical protein GQ53DRAFT_839891 [Thozetella sp. PMI_491]